MDRETARRKFDALCRMTEARGCTKEEAATAARLAKGLADKFGFEVRRDGSANTGTWEREARAARARAEAAARARSAREHKADWERQQRQAKEREVKREREEAADYARREEEARIRFGWEYR